METLFVLLALCEGNSPVTGEAAEQTVKLLWLEISWCSCDVTVITGALRMIYHMDQHYIAKCSQNNGGVFFPQSQTAPICLHIFYHSSSVCLCKASYPFTCYFTLFFYSSIYLFIDPLFHHVQYTVCHNFCFLTLKLLDRVILVSKTVHCTGNLLLWNWSSTIHTVEPLYNTVHYRRYKIYYNIDRCRIWIRLWTHKRHPIPRPYGRAMGCLLWVFWWKTIVL